MRRGSFRMACIDICRLFYLFHRALIINNQNNAATKGAVQKGRPYYVLSPECYQKTLGMKKLCLQPIEVLWSAYQ